MRNKHDDLVKQLHELADWVEKHNSVHSFSCPRWAAVTIERLEEENHQMRLRLNKRDTTLTDIVNRYIGYARLWIYMTRKKWKRN